MGLLDSLNPQWGDFSGGFDPTAASAGLGLLANMFQRPKYSTNIADVTGPDNTGFQNTIQAGLLMQRARQQKLAEAQAKQQMEMHQAQLEDMRRKQAAQDTLQGAITNAQTGGPASYQVNGLPALPDAPGGSMVSAPKYASPLDSPDVLKAYAGLNPAGYIQELQAQRNEANKLQFGPEGATAFRGGQPVAVLPKGPQTNLSKLLTERDALDSSDPRRRIYDSMIQKESERDPFVIGQVQTPNGTAMVAVPRPGVPGVPGGGSLQVGGNGQAQGTNMVPGGRVLAQGQSPAFTDAQLEKFRAADQARTQFKTATTEFENALKEGGGAGLNTWVNNPTDPKAVRINTAYNNMISLLRGESLYNTGVLQQGELSWLNSIMLNPQSLRGAMANPEAFSAQMNEMRKLADNNYEAMRGSFENSAKSVRGMRDGAVPPAEPKSENTSKKASAADIQATMKATMLPRAEVIKRLKAKGFSIEGE